MQVEKLENPATEMQDEENTGIVFWNNVKVFCNISLLSVYNLIEKDTC